MNAWKVVSCDKSKDGWENNTKIKYAKYIPVDLQFGEAYPKTLIDQESPSSWLDIQVWYTHYLDQKESKNKSVFRTLSDSIIKKSKKPKRSPSTSSLFSTNSDSKLLTKTKAEIFCTNKNKNARFGENSEIYLKMASENIYNLKSSISPIEVYVQMTKTQYSSLQLCYLKTEMVVKCLNTFFHPYGDCMVFWVLDLQVHALSNSEPIGVSSILNPDVSSWKGRHKVNAILYIGKDAAALLRHEDMCILDTIAASLGIKRQELLVVPLL